VQVSLTAPPRNSLVAGLAIALLLRLILLLLPVRLLAVPSPQAIVHHHIMTMFNCAEHCHWACMTLQVSLAAPPRNALIAGLAIALLLGGVANGVAPQLWQLQRSHPLLWLDQISYTR
jgi:hypothetical protein